MNDYDENKESSYINYWEVNNLYGWAMSQKLPVNNIEGIEETSQFNEDFIKSHDEKSEEGYFLEIDVQYTEKLYELHGNLPFLPERKKLKKVEKFATNLCDETEYVLHIRSVKQASKHGLLLKLFYGAISLNEDERLKPYIEMNTQLRKKAKNDFEKGFFGKRLFLAVFGKTMENVIKHRDIKLVPSGRRRNYLVSEPNYYTTKFFTENVLATEMKKTQITMNKPAYLELSKLDLIKTVMIEFWHDCLKPKYSEKVKLCYMDTDSFVFHVKTDDIYKRYCRRYGKRIRYFNIGCR